MCAYMCLCVYVRPLIYGSYVLLHCSSKFIISWYKQRAFNSYISPIKSKDAATEKKDQANYLRIYGNLKCWKNHIFTSVCF